MRVVRRLADPDELEGLVEVAEALRARRRGLRSSRYLYLKVFPVELGRLVTVYHRMRNHFPMPGPRQFYDAFFLASEAGEETPEHVDKGRVIRCNLVVVAPEVGGRFSSAGVSVKLDAGDAVVFDPAKPHAVSRIKAGRRLVFSTGLRDF